MLSGSVLKALELFGGEDASKIATFGAMFDKFFDCTNVCNFTDGKQSRNAFKAPYRSASDFRVEVSIHVYILNHYV